MKECVFFYLYFFLLWHCNVLSGVAPLDMLPAPHTDLIMCPSEALSPVGKEEIPGVGGSLSCEKSKWEAKAMDSLWRLCLFVSFRTAQTDSDRLKEKGKAIFLYPILIFVSGHHLGVVTNLISPPWMKGNTDEEGGKIGKEMKDQRSGNWINA